MIPRMMVVVDEEFIYEGLRAFFKVLRFGAVCLDMEKTRDPGPEGYRFEMKECHEIVLIRCKLSTFTAGRGMMSRMREHLNDLKFVFVTADLDPALHQRLFESGADAVFTKDTPLIQIQEKIETLIPPSFDSI